MGVPLNHPFQILIIPFKPSSYWGTPSYGNHIALIPRAKLVKAGTLSELLAARLRVSGTKSRLEICGISPDELQKCPSSVSLSKPGDRIEYSSHSNLYDKRWLTVVHGFWSITSSKAIIVQGDKSSWWNLLTTLYLHWVWHVSWCRDM